MKKLIGWSLVIAVLGAVSGLAQETYQPSCAATLKSKPWDFIQSYAAKNNDESEVGYDNAAIYWSDCKQKENAARLVKLPLLKAKLGNLYKNFNLFFNYETELAYSAAGGGTMYPHGRARFQPEIEIQIGKLIDLLSSKSGAAKNAAITARYSKAKQTLEARIKKVSSAPNPFVDGYTNQEAADKRREWLQSAKSYSAQYAAIRKNIGSGIDLASTTILEFLASGLWVDDLK